MFCSFCRRHAAIRCYEEGVLTSVADANIGSIFGWGFAAFKGGTLQFVNDYGVIAFRDRTKELAEKYGERWIYAKSGYSTIWLNRDTGEMSYGRGSDYKKYPCKVINYTELPSVSDEGKKF